MLTDAEFDSLRERIVGYELPGGTFDVAEYERWLSHDALKSPRLGAGILHPVWILVGALRGMGISTEQLLEVAGARTDDGVLFGETTLRQSRPLLADTTYQVEGEITSLTRRQGQRAGVMDLMVFVLRILDPQDGDPADRVIAEASQTYILMRGQTA